MARFQKSLEVPQPHRHQGTVDFTLFGRPSAAEREDHPATAERASFTIYTGTASVTVKMTAGSLRDLAALLIEAAETFPAEALVAA